MLKIVPMWCTFSQELFTVESWNIYCTGYSWKLWLWNNTGIFISWFQEININILNCIRHRAGSRDEMRWSPFIERLWIARVPADHVWRTITGADEMKWNKMNEMMRWVCKKWWNWDLRQGKTVETPRQKYPGFVSFNTIPTSRGLRLRQWDASA